jgi:hypothetical protein
MSTLIYKETARGMGRVFRNEAGDYFALDDDIRRTYLGWIASQLAAVKTDENLIDRSGLGFREKSSIPLISSFKSDRQ